VRPQLVRRDNTPTYHELISAFKARTGSPVVLNTSFNIHEEPIVRTPEEAIKSFLMAKLDYLALGDYLIAAEHTREAALTRSAGVRSST